MADLSYNNLRESKFDNIVSKTDKAQDNNINQLKLELYDSYRKFERKTTKFEPQSMEDNIKKQFQLKNYQK